MQNLTASNIPKLNIHLFGKVRHTYWKHTLLPEEPLTIPGKDGDDAPLYLERNIQRVLKKLEELEKLDREEDEE